MSEVRCIGASAFVSTTFFRLVFWQGGVSAAKCFCLLVVLLLFLRLAVCVCRHFAELVFLWEIAVYSLVLLAIRVFCPGVFVGWCFGVFALLCFLRLLAHVRVGVFCLPAFLRASL